MWKVLVILLCPVVWGMEMNDQQQADAGLLGLSEASNTFFQELYQKLIRDQTSAILSPTSLHMILSLTSAGARQQTLTDMRSTLNLDGLNAPAKDLYRRLIDILRNVSNVEVLLANAVYVKPGVNISDSFLRIAQDDYNAKVDNIDMDAPGGPERPINDYIEQQTQGNIKRMLQQGSIDQRTALVLPNTLFFNGTWKDQFNQNRTRRGVFHRLDDTAIQVDIMEDDRRMLFKEDPQNDLKVGELLFKNPRFALYIVLPNQKKGLIRLERSLTEPGKLNELFRDLVPMHTVIELPRFKIESSFDLTRELALLGMASAMNCERADFSGITDDAKVCITDVEQKAVIEVQETGTVAAAATVVSIGVTSVLSPATLKANHSFLFFLRDQVSEQILFQGRYTGHL